MRISVSTSTLRSRTSRGNSSGTPRCGEVRRAFDVDDFYPEEQYLEVCPRPETDTPLKNKYEIERPVSISTVLVAVIDDWLADQRPDVTDDHGRTPILASNRGRAHGQTRQSGQGRLRRRQSDRLCAATRIGRLVAVASGATVRATSFENWSSGTLIL